MDTARMARTGMVWVGTIMVGAAWGEFFPVNTLLAVVAGASIALVGLFIANLAR